MKTGNLSRMAVPIGVVAIVVMLVVPMPAMLLDLLIAGNLTFAVLVVLTAMFVTKPLDFSSFPSLLLMATLLRLALNISATRLVLTHGYAGAVIETFGHFVIGGSLMIGLVIFLILLIIQFVVITNGAGRVAEVGARFTLDAMPGKQMAIDADLNAGLIDEKTARTRRREISAEADFYGAMDGATRFVKGDAIAAIVITAVNFIGGIGIGVVQHHVSISQALSKYSMLSVGDGLVSQIPALLLSVSTGLIVTRSGDDDTLGGAVASQLGRHRMALQIAGGAAIVLALIPGLPKIPFIVVGAALLFAASKRKTAEAAEAAEAEQKKDQANAAPDPNAEQEALRTEIAVDPLELVLSPDLVSLVTGTGADLLDRIKGLRRSLAGELGLVMPRVRTRDNVTLPPFTYTIHINGVEVSRGTAPAGMILALGDGLDGLPGQPADQSLFGAPCVWLPEQLRGQAELLGASVVERSSVIITQLSDTVRTHAARLLGREDVAAATTALKRTHPVVVEDLTPALLTLGEIQRVLQALLDESVSIRDLVRIYEALSGAAKGGTDLDRLVEAARTALAPAIVAQHCTDGVLSAITIEPRLQQTLLESVRPTDGGMQLVVEPGLAESLIASVSSNLNEASTTGVQPVLVVPAPIRAAVRRLVRLAAPNLAILSFPELATSSVTVNAVGVVDDVRALVS